MNNNIYANGYQCAMDDGESEVVINYLLTIPRIQGDSMAAETETVATVIMSKEMAEKLMESIQEILDKSKSNRD